MFCLLGMIWTFPRQTESRTDDNFKRYVWWCLSAPVSIRSYFTFSLCSSCTTQETDTSLKKALGFQDEALCCAEIRLKDFSKIKGC